MTNPNSPEGSDETDIEQSGILAHTRPAAHKPEIPGPRPGRDWLRLYGIVLGAVVLIAAMIYVGSRGFTKETMTCADYVEAYRKLPSYLPASEEQTKRYDECRGDGPKTAGSR